MAEGFRSVRPPKLPIDSSRWSATTPGRPEASGHPLGEPKAPLFLPLHGKLTGAGISAEGIYALVGAYAKAATNALEHEPACGHITPPPANAHPCSGRYDSGGRQP